ncbi:MAG: bifunctional sugar-1-phosphate nucleotidylyltransferase/acetyltransferase [Candidatus Micrarchaeia archaeon]
MKAVILCAGEGKRLRPLTYTTPKPMLYVAGKPIIAHLLIELKKAGITEAVIVVKYLKEKIIEYLGKNNFGIKISFVEQKERYGTGAALLYVKEKIKESFLMVAGDSLVDCRIIKTVINAHKKGIAVGIKNVKEPQNYGIVQISNGVITKIEEKPKNAKTTLANISVYMFEKNIFEKLEKIRPSVRGEYEITDILLGAMAVEVEGFWADIAYPWELFDANEYLLKNSKSDTELGTIENSTINGKVILEKGAKIINSYIDGNSYIGKNTIIGPNAYLRGNNSIGNNCSVGGGTTIKNCILFDDVNAKHLAYLGDSIIGNKVNFGSGTQIANYRFDSSTVNVLTERKWINSKRKKLGVVVGDNTKFGVSSCTMPGKLIGNNCWIGSGAIINKNIEPNTKVFVRQEHILMKNEGE